MTGQILTLSVESNFAIELIKKIIQDKEGITDQQRLIFPGIHLINECSFGVYNIQKESTIHLF